MNNEKFEQLRLNFLPRFWDTVNKVMIYPENLEDIGVIYRTNAAFEGDYERLYVIVEDYYNDYIMMKPTSLKDKNGKLIYEGDCFIYPIIPSDDCEGFLEEEKCYVKWFANSFCLVSMKTDEYIGGVCNCKKLKIISNIHENKEN